jgi:hypothetical protein
MNQHLNLTSIGRVLLGPWQQRRNQAGLWGLAIIAFACILLVIAIGFARGGSARGFVLGTVVLLGMWSAGAWALLVLNVLEQNHPTFARLVPRQPRHLRAALLLSWAALIGFTALAGAAFSAPVLAWATAAAALLVVLAAALRWPLLWLLGCVAPFMTLRADEAAWVPVLLDRAGAFWTEDAWLVAPAVWAGGAAFLASLVRRGDARHVADHRARRSQSVRFQSRALGIQPLAAGDGPLCWPTRLSALPYTWWMRRTLARPGSSPMARALLGLGPAAHWTTRAGGVLVTVVLCLFAILACFLSPLSAGLGGAVSGLTFGALFGLVAPTLQFQARLHQTQREQALLMLLPGVARQGALNRWLSAYLTLQFVLTWGVALLVVRVLDVAASALAPEPVRSAIGDGRGLMAVAMIPLVAFQWRQWARMPAPTQWNAMLPYLLGLALGAATFVLRVSTGAGYVVIGAGYAALALAWFGVRWRRMGGEPSALPAGRLAR